MNLLDKTLVKFYLTRKVEYMPFRNISKYIFVIFLSILLLLINFPSRAQDTEDIDAHRALNEEEHQPRPASFVRALIGMSFVMVPGIAWYYYENSNKRDQLFGKNDILNEYLTKPFALSKMKFDDNVFETNSPSHPLAGTAYYLSARTSGFNMWQSSLFTFGGSVFWECLIEIQEVTSINDMVFTPIGGITIGEGLFQLAAFYAGNAKSQNFFNNFISDQVDIAKYRYTNGTGPNSSIWHNICGFVGVLYELDDMAGGKFGMEAEFFGIRNLKLHGTSSGFHLNSPYTKIVTSAAFSKKLQEVFLYSETGIMGYSKQRITQSGGYSSFFSLNSAFEYNNKNFADFHDKISTIHLLGPVADISFIKGNFIIRLRNSIFYDFTMIESMGLPEYYIAGHTRDDVRNKGALCPSRTGYYYAQGFTAASMMAIDIYSFELGGEFMLNRYYSFNGDGMTNDEPKYHENFVMRDTRISSKLFVQYSAKNNVAYKLGATYSILKGKADGYSRRLSALRTEFLTAYCM